MWSTDEMSGLFICFFSNFSNSRRMPSISSFTFTRPLLLIPLARNQSMISPVKGPRIMWGTCAGPYPNPEFLFLDRVISHFLTNKFIIPGHFASAPDTTIHQEGVDKGAWLCTVR